MAINALLNQSSRCKSLCLVTLMAATLAVACPSAMADMPRATLDALFDKASLGDKLAFASLQKEAEQGNAAAGRFLGIMYSTGKGINQDHAAARKWFHDAAEKGLASAQSNLASMYARGAGVARDQNEAIRWWRKSAEQGYPLAQFNLGQAYRNGDGVPVDMATAVSWFQKGADQNEPNSQFNLAIAYANGDGVPRDFVRAHMWWHIASITAGFAGPGEKMSVGAWNNMTQIAKDMTKEQIETANREATQWMAAHPKSL